MAGAGFMLATGGPTFISSGTVDSNSGPASTVNGNAPSSYVANDLLISIGWANSTAVNWNTTSGWTEAYDQGAVPSLGLQYKVSAGGDGAFTLTSGSSFSDYAYTSSLAIRFASFDAVGAEATIVADGDLVIPAITSAGGLVLAIVATDGSFTVTTPTGWQHVAGINGNRFMIFAKTLPSGTTGTVTVPISGVSGTVVGVLLGLR